MHYLIVSDIADPRRLRRAARVCERYGARVQNSVYLMELEVAELQRLQADLSRLLHHTEDQVRYYPLCKPDLRRSKGEGLSEGLLISPGHWLI